MKPSKSPPLAIVGIVVGWSLFVMLGFQLIDKGIGLWQRHSEALDYARATLSRLQGWLTVNDEVATRHDFVLGPFAHKSNSDVAWVGFQGFQQAAQAQGLSVTEVRPSELTARPGSPPIFRLDAKVVGRVEQVSSLLTQLPDLIPGVRLMQLSISPHEGAQVQTLLRLDFSGEVVP